jgi:hypothetical protein
MRPTGTEHPLSLFPNINYTEAEFMNVQFCWGSGHNLESSPTWGFRRQCLHYKLVSNQFCSKEGGGGVKSVGRGDCEEQWGKLLRLLSRLRPRIRPQDEVDGGGRGAFGGFIEISTETLCVWIQVCRLRYGTCTSAVCPPKEKHRGRKGPPTVTPQCRKLL